MDKYDVVIVGGGHNGLVAAAYLARADLSVLVLERLDHVGGAAVSAPAFSGLPARPPRRPPAFPRPPAPPLPLLLPRQRAARAGGQGPRPRPRAEVAQRRVVHP